MWMVRLIAGGPVVFGVSKVAQGTSYVSVLGQRYVFYVFQRQSISKIQNKWPFIGFKWPLFSGNIGF